MRLDLFLKYSCLVPRRTAAKRLCDTGHVLLNQRAAKASTAISAGDVLEVVTGLRKRTLRVLEIPAGQIARKDSSKLYLLTGDIVIQESSDIPGSITYGSSGF